VRGSGKPNVLYFERNPFEYRKWKFYLASEQKRKGKG
jgi:hypothetical protein